MKRLRGYFRLILLLPLLIPANVFALSTPSGVIISELQTTGLANATSEEFVEIYNPTSQTIDISTWKMQYLSAGGTSWQTKATLNGYLYPQGRLLLASNNYLVDEVDIAFTSGFKLEAGHVRIVSVDPADDSIIVQDLVGWGTALQPETEPAVYAPAGSSLVRRVDTEGEHLDTDNNKNDFDISASPTPQSANIEPEALEEEPIEEEIVEEQPEEEIEEPVDETTPEEPIEVVEEVIPEEPSEQENLLPIEITELLPNPAAPLSDSVDEYIELYNPNNEPFNLKDYKLQSGSAFSYSYTFDYVEIDPTSYLVLYVSQTGLTLANGSGQARMISPNGTVTFQTDPYQDAGEGESWSLIDGVWQWTKLPTAGVVNALVVPVAPATATTPTTTKKKTATKKAATKPKAAKAPKKTKEKTAKDSAVAGATNESGSGDDSGGTSPIHMWVIAGIGAIALGYALYEYKDDIRNKIFKFRRNRALSRSIGTQT